jgi:hypothetical protein
VATVTLLCHSTQNFLPLSNGKLARLASLHVPCPPLPAPGNHHFTLHFQ